MNGDLGGVSIYFGKRADEYGMPPALWLGGLTRKGRACEILEERRSLAIGCT